MFFVVVLKSTVNLIGVKEFQKITLHQKKEIIIRPIKVQMKNGVYQILVSYTLNSLIKFIGLIWLMQ